MSTAARAATLKMAEVDLPQLSQAATGLAFLAQGFSGSQLPVVPAAVGDGRSKARLPGSCRARASILRPPHDACIVAWRGARGPPQRARPAGCAALGSPTRQHHYEDHVDVYRRRADRPPAGQRSKSEELVHLPPSTYEAVSTRRKTAPTCLRGRADRALVADGKAQVPRNLGELVSAVRRWRPRTEQLVRSWIDRETHCCRRSRTRRRGSSSLASAAVRAPICVRGD